MLAHGQTVIQLFERMVPKKLAVPDDKIGLQLGSLQKSIPVVLVALDVTDEVVEEAIHVGANLIIAHHAIIYRALSHLMTDTPSGRLYEKLIKHDIAVYIAHTNYDIVEGGMNDLMAEALDLTVLSHLESVDPEHGLGRVGKLPAPQSLSAFAQQVKKAFDVPFVRVIGNPDKEIRKAAVLGGAGSRYVRHAQFAGADVLVTGDIDYHTAHDALASGMAIIDPGHNAEKIMKTSVAGRLQEMMQKEKYTTSVLASQINTEPFRFE